MLWNALLSRSKTLVEDSDTTLEASHSKLDELNARLGDGSKNASVRCLHQGAGDTNLRNATFVSKNDYPTKTHPNERAR